MSETWSHLQALEAESIYIIREVVAQFRNPVLLYSIGKDSSVLVHLARKAFYPGPIPFPLLHVDTGYKFPEMLKFREEFTKAIGARLIVHRNEEAIADGAHPLKLGVARCCGALKTGALLQALEKYQFDAAIGGARRDEERSRAKERIFSFRDSFGQWDPRNQRPELWNLYNGEIHEGESMRVFPLSNWTERDVWQYIQEQNIPIVPLYYARQRQVVYRGTNWIPIDNPADLREGETTVTEWVRFRTLGCMPCTGAVQSEAQTIEEIVAEAGAATRSERETRIIDHGANTMEDKKTRGILLKVGLLRFITAGSVDDGKSTLIGRLLVDARGAFEDQISSAQRDNERRGGKGIDFSLLTDGLKAEREQGITIDVAYRYFNTPRRKFIIADAPGHEQYTRNMVTGASTADLALILVDARQGLVTQSRRHAFLAHLVGIRHVIVAVNKMDLVDFKQEVYDRICSEFKTFFERLGPTDLRFIPISALQGDMVVERGNNFPWYTGDTVMETLETIEIEQQDASHLRFPIQLVNRPPMPELHDFRGYMGKIASGRVSVGQQIAIMPGGRQTKVTGIAMFDGERQTAFAPQSVTITLAEDLDASRGDMIVGLEDGPQLRTEFEASVCWMSSKPMKPGGKYRLRHTTKLMKAIVSGIQHRLDPNTIEKQTDVTELRQNDIARITIKTLQPLPCDAYRDNRETGAFLLIDDNNDSVGAGFIEG